MVQELVELENEIKYGIIQNKAMEEKALYCAEQGPILKKIRK